MTKSQVNTQTRNVLEDQKTGSPPRITLLKETIEQMKKAAKSRNVSISQAYQDACGLYLKAEDFLRKIKPIIAKEGTE